MLIKNLVFHCSERDTAEDIMNIFEWIVDYKAKKEGVVSPNVYTNMAYDYAENSFFVHLRSDVAFTDEEYNAFQYIIEYLYIIYSYNISTAHQFRRTVEKVRNSGGLFSRGKNKFKKLQLNEFSDEALCHLDNFFRKGYLYETEGEPSFKQKAIEEITSTEKED